MNYECVCDPQNYQYYIYAGLGVLVLLSETLGISQKIKSNSIVQLVMGVVNKVKPTQTENKSPPQEPLATP